MLNGKFVTCFIAVCELKFNSETYKIALFSNTLTISLQFKDDSWT